MGKIKDIRNVNYLLRNAQRGGCDVGYFKIIVNKGIPS